MIKRSDLKVGLRVMYVPSHIREECSEYRYAEYPDTELGFVTSWNDTYVFCRFFSRYTLKLRTVANSEACDISDLFPSDFISQEFVDKTISSLRLFPAAFGWIEQNDRK